MEGGNGTGHWINGVKENETTFATCGKYVLAAVNNTDQGCVFCLSSVYAT